MSTEPPRLYLITPPIPDAGAFAPKLEAALALCDIACACSCAAGARCSENKKIIARSRRWRRRRGVAVLVEGDAQLALRAGADGCHVEGAGEALEAAVAALQPDRIVGAGGLASRDAAMEAGEFGVDYVMFGGPDEAQPHEGIVERAAWWAEIFNVPCVAYAHALTMSANSPPPAPISSRWATQYSTTRAARPALAEVAAQLAALPRYPAKTREKAQ